MIERHEHWSDGWYRPARQWHSPHFCARADDEIISLVVIHNISLPPFEYGTEAVKALFTQQIEPDEPDVFMRSIRHLKVSSHFLIERDGRLTQFVSCNDAAYQAGVSCFGGRAGCNAFSIGIELEGCDFEPFTALQYQQLIGLLHQIADVYPIEAITGHQHIAAGRKSDPGHFFEWAQLQQAGLPVVTQYQYA
ncbi:1,6-anhydro-N-acetylmuramyl-L-alanine amidase AmpD [Neisseriaceae bacterium ESL0693]|nr:1,6-anhydro-N-acetylmuramyl-L-alanine amidase AmpD [Neisseriaceae bacterium ESL0693]